MRKRIVLTFVLLALGPVAGCGGGREAAADGRTEVAAAFYPLAFAAEEIGGAGVAVANVTPPGAEPHDVELSARDVERIRGADLVLYLGGGFQPALEAALEGAGVEAVDLLAGLELRREDEHGHGHEEAEEHVSGEQARDPHVWLDPLRYAELAARIGAALGRERAADELRGRLRRLDRELARGLADCERREIVSSHAAFGYLAERYGLEPISLAGLAPEAEPGPREVERVVAAVRERGATTVFVEPLASSRLADTVAREAGARTAVLDPLEGLTQEQLDRGEDYFSVMRDNLEALREALGCR